MELAVVSRHGFVMNNEAEESCNRLYTSANTPHEPAIQYCRASNRMQLAAAYHECSPPLQLASALYCVQSLRGYSSLIQSNQIMYVFDQSNVFNLWIAHRLHQGSPCAGDARNSAGGGGSGQMPQTPSHGSEPAVSVSTAQPVSCAVSVLAIALFLQSSSCAV
jgi:hypothetical protein